MPLRRPLHAGRTEPPGAFSAPAPGCRVTPCAVLSRSSPLAALAAALALLAPGCDDAGDAGEVDDRAIVRLSFDEYTYVDASIPNRKLMERVRHQNESIFSSLRHADVMITAKRLVAVDLAHLEREPVTVVDPATGITRAAMRVRYHFLALALAPRALAQQGSLALAALHTPSPALGEQIVATCSANGDHERAAVTEPWTVFNGALPRCAAAATAEQAAVDAARAKLANPDREIVSSEFERTYVPVVVNLRERRVQPEGGGTGDFGRPGMPGRAGAAPPDNPEGWTWVDKEREREFAREDDEDERELARLARPSGGGISRRDGPVTWSSSVYLQPNFTILYVAVIALGLILVGWRRSDQRRR